MTYTKAKHFLMVIDVKLFGCYKLYTYQNAGVRVRGYMFAYVYSYTHANANVIKWEKPIGTVLYFDQLGKQIPSHTKVYFTKAFDFD